MDDPPSSEIIIDFPPVFRIYRDLRVDRLIGNDAVPAGHDAATGVTSRDVSIDHDTGVYVRLYLPDMAAEDDNRRRRLPVVVYYHGGGFVAMSAACAMYHSFLNALAAKARAVVVSVNYRLATEHPFPVGYEDSFRALQWVLSSSSSSSSGSEEEDKDPWLSRHGDPGRVILAGDSAGANIAHKVAVMMAATRLQDSDTAARRIEGVALLHPAFWGKEPLAGEETPEWTPAFMERLWGLVCPGAEDGVDDQRMNPLAPAAAMSMSLMPCRRMLVCVADGDFLRHRGRSYYEGVKASGWGGALEWLESTDSPHCFFLHQPDGPRGVELMDRLVVFIAGPPGAHY